MGKYDNKKIINEIIEFCKFYVPRTPIDIVRHIKYLNPSFYPKTPDKQVVKFLRSNFLNNLVNEGILVKYTPNLLEWKKIRKFMSFYEKNKKNRKTRKVSELYQINFFHFGSNEILLKVPVLNDMNLDFIALLNNSFEKKDIEKVDNFSLNLINLLMAYKQDKRIRDKIRIQLYDSQLNEKKINSIEKLLEYSFLIKEFLNKIPLKPDEEKALNFLNKLIGNNS